MVEGPEGRRLSEMSESRGVRSDRLEETYGGPDMPGAKFPGGYEEAPWESAAKDVGGTGEDEPDPTYHGRKADSFIDSSQPGMVQAAENAASLFRWGETDESYRE